MADLSFNLDPDLPYLPSGNSSGTASSGEDRPPAFSDEAIALRFAATHADNLRFVASWGKWLSWQGTHWKFDDTMKGEQRMVVQHVNVAEGGQAIVGNVNSAPPGGGAQGKNGDQPHALGYAPGVEVLCKVEKEQAEVPCSSSERPADMSNARRD